MTREEKVQAVVGVLEEVEERLSDGYQYYCVVDEGDVPEMLMEIASRILDAIGD